MSTHEVEHLLVDIAPHELRGERVYVVRKQELPDHLGGGCDVDGWTSPTLDLQLKQVIGERWQGRGAALVASGENIKFVAVVLHELAHVIDRDRLYAELPVGFNAADMAEHTHTMLTGPTLTTTEVVLAHHSPRWCRLLAHLVHRARRINRRVRESDAFGYSHLRAFAYTMLLTIEDEMEQYRDQPLKAVASLPMPETFLTVWHESADWCRELEARFTTTTTSTTP